MMENTHKLVLYSTQKEPLYLYYFTSKMSIILSPCIIPLQPPSYQVYNTLLKSSNLLAGTNTKNVFSFAPIVPILQLAKILLTPGLNLQNWLIKLRCKVRHVMRHTSIFQSSLPSLRLVKNYV